MAAREVVRPLAPGEVAVLRSAIERASVHAMRAEHAQELADEARHYVVAMVGLLNGGKDPTVTLDQERWELVRVPPPVPEVAP
jgi:hypothetical protein